MFHIVSSLGTESGDLFNNCTSLLLKVWDGFSWDLLMLPFHQKTCDDFTWRSSFQLWRLPVIVATPTVWTPVAKEVSWFDLSSVYLRMSFNTFLRWEDSRFIAKHLLEGSKIHVSRVEFQVICGKKGILPQCIGCVIFRKFLQLGKKNLSAAPPSYSWNSRK